MRTGFLLLVCCLFVSASSEWHGFEGPAAWDAATGPERTAAREPAREDSVRMALRSWLAKASDAPSDAGEGERLHAVPWLKSFYAAREHAPAWSERGVPRPAVDSLLAAIRKADLEGLRPADYHQAALLSLLLRVRYGGGAEPADLVELDLLATDAFLTYASHLRSGVVDPTTLGPTVVSPAEIDLPARLAEVLEHGRVQESFRELLFAFHPGYFRIRSALARYRAIAGEGGWPLVPEGDTLWPGDRGPAVAVLRARLAVSGDLPSTRGDLPPATGTHPRPAAADAFLFDAALEDAVRRFQRRHGLAVDGVVGPATLAALNVPADERVRQLELNMERWRWLPPELGARYILVNIAAFQVEVFEHIEPVLRLRTIVGREYRQTPVFSDTMTYLVLNPSWNVPRGLAAREKLPLFQRDTEAVRRLGYRIYEHWGRDAPELDPDTMEWNEIPPERFREFRVWQAPGPHNALGKVKFMFPNAFDVYLHDTPERELFGRRTRDFSSGCIRVENALDLAAYVLADQESWSRERIERAVAGDKEIAVSLARPIPVHLQYWTAWTETDGTVQFREDLYHRDARLAAVLGQEARGIPDDRFR